MRVTTSRVRIIVVGLLLLGSALTACGSCAESNDKDKGKGNGGKPFHVEWDGGRRVFKAFGDGGRRHRRHGEGGFIAGDGGSPLEEGQPE